MGQRGRPSGGEGVDGGLSRRILDLTDAEQYCSEPSPLDQVRRAFAELEPGGVLEVRSRVAEHAFAVRVWARREGVAVLDDSRDGDVHVVTLQR